MWSLFPNPCRLPSRIDRALLIRRALSLLALALCIVLHLLTGDGLLTKLHVALRRATTPPCTPGHLLLPDAAIPRPRALTVCNMLGEDNFRSVHEWLAFHLAQGVQRFDMVYDLISPFNATTYSRFLEVLEPRVREGIVFTHRKEDARPWLRRLGAQAKAARAADPRACGPAEADTDALLAQLAECEREGATWCYQRIFHALCVGEARLRGDRWLGLFDGDEYFFQPGRPGMEGPCFYGGRPPGEEPGAPAAVDVDSRRGADELGASECALPLSEAPLLVGRGLAAALDSHWSGWGSISVRGVAFGLNDDGAYRRKGLVMEAHTRTARYDYWGFQVGPPGREYLACPEAICGKMAPHKSFIAVEHAPAGGTQVHVHQVGAVKTYFPGKGAPLRLNHYHADDMEALEWKSQWSSTYTNLIENKEGIKDYMRSWPDNSGRAFSALLHFCMNSSNWRHAACWAPG